MSLKEKITTNRHAGRTPFGGSYAGKQVFLTGHTGFKGSWLCEWLLALGARVTGFSLPPPTRPALFDQLDLAHRVTHRLGDIRDAKALAAVVARARPDFIFHLAAQPLVRESYRSPVETWNTNVLGTIHLLEAVRRLPKPCAVVCVTSDKCYENREQDHGYAEADPLGGHDPYSSSKAAAEIAIAAWRRSYLHEHSFRIASARAGNVIGGGDWADDRIIPDCVRALQRNRPAVVRNPRAIRPWQHVLEPLSGYLWLGAQLAGRRRPADPLCSAFNFGPGPDAKQTVQRLVLEILKHWPGRCVVHREAKAVHEAGLLQLDTAKTARLLDWLSVWSFADAARETMRWYRAADQAASRAELQRLTREQIESYTESARRRGLRWATA